MTSTGRRSGSETWIAAQADIQKCACNRSGQIGLEPVPELLGEFGHVSPQLILGQRARGSGGHVHDVIAGARRDPLVQVRLSRGVDDHIVTLSNQSGGQLGDVHVLTARINAADHRKRAGVFGDQSDAHDSPSQNTFRSSAMGYPGE